MSATRAKQGGRVQLEQSNMRLAFDMAKMTSPRISHVAIEEMQSLIKKRHAKVQEEKKWGVEFPGHKKVIAAIERQTAMLCQNHTAGCLRFQTGPILNSQIHWHLK